MGMIYSVNKLAKKNTENKRKNMTAQELAVLSRVRGNEEVSSFQTGDMFDLVDIEDHTTKSDKAKGFGFASWMKGLFSDKIDFKINGTQIAGRRGYQVRGGAVPLFDGVVLDLLPASLTGEIEGDTNVPIQTASGSGAKLVMSPRNTNSMEEVFLSWTAIKSSSKNAYQIEAVSVSEIEFPMEEKRITGSGLRLTEKSISVNKPNLVREGEEEPLEMAGMGEDGKLFMKQKKAAIKPENSNSQMKPEKEPEAEKPDALREGYEAVREKCETLADLPKAIEEYVERIGLAKEYIQKIFSGEKPEFPEVVEEDGESGTITLADIPLFPGISFQATLEPDIKLGLGGSLAVEIPKGKTQESMDRILSIGLSLKGSLGATLKLAMVLGSGYLVGLSGGLFATGTLKGNLGENAAFAEAVTQQKITYNPKTKKFKSEDSLKVGLSGGLNLLGSLGGSIDLQSKLFDFEKNLYEVTFGEWTLASLSMQMKLTKRKGGSSLFSLAGWEKEESSFSASLFGQQVANRKTDNYGLRVVVNEEKVGNLAEAAEDDIAELQKLLQVFEKLQGIETRGNFLAPGSEAFQRINQKRKDVEVQIREKLMVSQTTLEGLSRGIREITQSKAWKKNMASCEKQMDKHQKRLARMEEWKQETEKKGGDTRDAYDHYTEDESMGVFRTKAGKYEEEQLMEEEKRKVGSRAELIRYERERVSEKAKKHHMRIAQIKQYMKEQNGKENFDEPSEAFLEAYSKMEKDGSPARAKRMTALLGGNREMLAMYENSRVEELQKIHRIRLEKLKKKKEELKITSQDEPNQQFCTYYQQELGAKRMFKNLVAYGNVSADDILKSEQEEMGAGTEKHHERQVKIREYLKRQQVEKDDKKKKDIENEAKEWYFGKEEGQEKASQILNSASRYKYTTAEEILNYERNRLKEKRMEFEKSNASYKKWVSKKGAEGNDDYFIDRVSLAEIKKYEAVRAAEKKGQDHKAKHNDRMKAMEDAEIKIRDMTTDKNKEQLEKSAKTAYFGSGIVSGQGTDAARFLNLLKKGEFKTKQLNEEYENEAKGEKHADRIEAIKKLQAEGKNSLQIWNAYVENMDGKQFKEELSQSKVTRECLTLEQILQYEESAGREKAETFLEKVKKWKAGAKSQDVVKGYDLYWEINNWKEEGKSDEEIAARYQALGGGRKLNIKLEKTAVSTVTPNQIFNYEENRRKEAAAKHLERLKLIDTFPQEGDYVELYQKYHEMAQRDGDGGKDKWNALLQRVHIGSGMTGFDSNRMGQMNTILTPNMILQYEERRVLELTCEHRQRMDNLEAAQSDEEAFQFYENAGGERFFKKRKEDWKDGMKQRRKEFWTYERIISYEQGRKNFYQEAQDKTRRPVEVLEEKQKEIQEVMARGQEAVSTIEGYAQNPETVFAGEAKFKAYTDSLLKQKEKQEEVQREQEEVSILEKQSENVNVELKRFAEQQLDDQEIELFMKEMEQKGA